MEYRFDKNLRFSAHTFELIKEEKKSQTTRPIRSLESYKSKIGLIINAESRNTNVRTAQCKIKIIDCFEKNLADVAKQDFILEGCASPEEFRDVWISIYHSFGARRKVCVIRFKLVKETMDMYIVDDARS
jgi:hypothetical protein